MFHLLYKYKYEISIILIIASLSYGSYEIFGAFNPLRIIGLCVLPIVIKNIKWYFNNSFLKNWTVLIVFWWVFMTVSLLWTNNTILGVTYYIHMTLMFSCMLFLVRACYFAKNPLKAVSNGWLIFCIICMPIAFWEITTGNHLESGSINADSYMSDGSLRVFAAVTFGNLNSFVFMICLELPFLAIQILNNKNNYLYKLICFIAIVISSIVLLINASRAGIICVIMVFFLLAVQSYKHNTKIAKAIIICLGASIIFYILKNMEEIEMFAQIQTRLSTRSSVFEDNDRQILIQGAIDIILSIYGFGGGIMSMIGLYEQYTLCSITYAHNFFLEIIIEYGIVIGILVFIMFYSTIFMLRKNRTSEYILLFWYSLLTSPLLLVLDDYYQPRSGVWIYIGLLIAIANRIKYNMKNEIRLPKRKNCILPSSK